MILMMRAALLAAVLLVAVVLAPAGAGAVEVQRVVSPGGIEAWLVESHEVPVISMQFAFRGGTELDPEGKEGLANLVSTLLDEGAGPLDSAEFQQRLADAAIDLDFEAGVDAFQGSLKTVTAESEEAFDLLRLALTEPRFDAEAVERMRAAVFASIRSKVSDPEWLGFRTYLEAAFPGHPYGRPSRGTAATLAAITTDDLRSFVADRFGQDQLVIGVTGDITPERLGTVLDEVFGDLPAAAEPFTIPETAPAGAGARVLVRRDGPQSVMLVGQPGIDRQDPDYYAAYVMNHILGGGGFGSRLTETLREERGLTYGVGSFLVTYDRADMLMATTALSNANVAEALDIIRAQWRGMAEDGVTAEELADAKTYLTGSFPLRLTSTDRIAGMLVSMQLEDLGIDYIDERAALIEAVTLEDVNRVAADLLQPDALSVVVTGAPPDGAFAPDRTLTAADLAARELGEGDI